MQLKIIKTLFNRGMVYRAGTQVEVKDDGQGNPLERFWRNRLKDAEMDGSIEIIKTTKKSTGDK